MSTAQNIETTSKRGNPASASAQEEIMGVVVKFSTAGGGCFIEDLPGDHQERTGAERCWRFDSKGRSEWTTLSDLLEGNARWYGHQFTEADFIFC
jgi:hypothetical protein